MDPFLQRKKRKLDDHEPSSFEAKYAELEEDSTELKLAILASLHPDLETETLLEALTSSDGSVEKASVSISPKDAVHGSPTKGLATPGIQSSLRFGTSYGQSSPGPATRSLTKKGKTLHLYSPEDIASHTPCSIIHNFLSPSLADELLSELMTESQTFTSASFKLFDNVVQSPHTYSFYVSSLDEANQQKQDYVYNGSYLNDVRQITPLMQRVSDLVKEAVNVEIKRRIQTHYPNGQKLQYQTPKQWQPNAAFVNRYAGAKQSVGFHSDQLTYLGPRAIIGSLSLGVAREFRVRKIVPKDNDSKSHDPVADASGQIAIHLPHNSLLTMHAEMQEEWKHCISPALTITPHPISGTSRINITYRWYRESFHPKYTPRCRCGLPCVLRCVQRKKENRGRYMWMCHAGFTPPTQAPKAGENRVKHGPTSEAKEKKDGDGSDGSGGGCSYFQWAEFDDDGEPEWMWSDKKKKNKKNRELPGDESRNNGTRNVIGKFDLK